MWPFPKRVNDAEFADGNQRAILSSQVRQVLDGLANINAGLGTARDKRVFSEWDQVRPLTRFQLGNMWRSSWHIKKGVTIPVDDAFSEWFSVQWDGSDADTSRQQKFDEWEKRFNVRTQLVEANWWANLYGGGLIIIGVKGETDLSQPLEIESVRRGSLDYLYTIDRWQCGPVNLLNKPEDLGSPNFGKPGAYALGSVSTSSTNVHWTRVIPFYGKRLPWFEWLANGMWDDSAVQHVYEDVRDHGSVMSLLATMFFEANVDVMAVDSLAQVLALPKGEEKIRHRFQVAAEQKSANRMLMMDAKDKYEKKGNNFTGLAAIVEQFKGNLIGAFDIPATRFYGISPGGLNSTGDGDMDNYRKRLKGDQTSKYQAGVERLYKIACMDLFGEVPPGFKIAWNPLDQETKGERAQRELANSQRDSAYVQAGVLSPQVVVRQLKEDDVYTVLEDSDVQDVKDMSEQMDALQGAALLGRGPAAKPGQLGAKPPPVPTKALKSAQS